MIIFFYLPSLWTNVKVTTLNNISQNLNVMYCASAQWAISDFNKNVNYIVPNKYCDSHNF